MQVECIGCRSFTFVPFMLPDKDGWRYLFPVRDATLRSRLALRCLDQWPLAACLEILAYCSSDPEVSEELQFDLHSKTRELKVYQKVHKPIVRFPLFFLLIIFLDSHHLKSKRWSKM